MTTYTDNDVPADATYQVSVVYTLGESALSNKVNLKNPNGIAVINASQSSIVTGRGSLGLNNITGAPVVVYNVAGAVVYKGSDSNVNLNVPAGVYLVNVAGKTVKVAVK